MKYGQLAASVPVMKKLSEQPLHLKQAYQLMKMVRKIDEELVFFREKYKEIMESDRSDEEKIKMQMELLNFEVEWELEPFRLSVNDPIELSVSDLANTEGLIEITE